MLKKISNDDWQYLIPISVCVSCFIATDFLELFDKTSVAYWSGRLFFEPYRVITSHFFHGDANHLLANISGIIVSRYFLKALGLRNNYFFLTLTALLIPLQSSVSWVIDIFFYRNPMALTIGFSGILYGVNAFLLLSAIYGKGNFVFLNCSLSRDLRSLKSLGIITLVGIVWSFLPGISFIGHLSGFISGLMLFFL